MGSTFIAGLLASGVESQLALSIAKTAEIMKNQIQLQQTQQECYKAAAIASGDAVAEVDNKTADTDRAGANVYFCEGGLGFAAPAASAGLRTYRENSSEMAEFNANSKQIEECQESLHKGEGQVISGKLEGNSEDLEELKHKSVLSNKKVKTEGYTKEDKEKLGLVKKLRSNGPKNESSRNGRLYDELDEKLNKELDGINNRRQRYEGDTDRYVGYVQSFSNSVVNFGKAGAQVVESNVRRNQADADKMRSIADYAVNNQKSGVDTTQQAYQNTAQLYSEEIRTFSDIARANAAV